MDKLYLLSGIFVLMTSLGASASVGAAPGSIEFGEVSPGETIEQDIYVTTNFQDSFQVDPSFSSARKSDIFDESTRFETSEEDISDWIELDSTSINGNSSEQFQLDDGTYVNSNGEITLSIDVPSNAEPGYHHGTIRLNPELTSNEEGAPGSLNWGETAVPFRFKVEGDAQRQLSVMSVRGFRLGESKAAVEVLLRNSGTVTTSTEGFSFQVFDRRRNRLTSLYANGEILAPGEEAWVDAIWNSDDQIEEGKFQIDGEVDYITGSTTASGGFSLPGINRVEVRPSEDEENEESGGGFPIWFVVIVLSILGVLMWGFDIEPFWIVAIVGVLGISAFILLSGVPNYLLAILLSVVGLIVYGGI